MGLDGSVGTGLDVMRSIVTSSSSRARSVSCAPCLESRGRRHGVQSKEGVGDGGQSEAASLQLQILHLELTWVYRFLD
jgi:hypothetical protein